MCYFCFLIPFINAGCQDNQFNCNEMRSAEASYNERSKQALLAYMSLNIMFPDANARALAEAASLNPIRVIKALSNPMRSARNHSFHSTEYMRLH